MADDSYHVATVPKNGREELRIRVDEYRGHTYVDLRIFADTGGEDHVPTGKGVTIPPARLGDVLEALVGAQAELRRRGLIG